MRTRLSEAVTRQLVRIALMPLLLAQIVCAASAGRTAGTPAVAPESRGPSLNQDHLRRIDELVDRAIAEKKLPGAVVLIGHRGAIVYEKVFGHRSLVPETEAMTLDTVFDIASLTKVVFTTTAVMMLVEEGRLRLSDKVAAHIPGFGVSGKDEITIAQLLTHRSGLRPGLDLTHEWTGPEAALRLATEDKPIAAPGERFVYSDINFILLGAIVSRVSGMPIERFARERVFGPLGMSETSFLPPQSLRPRTAPTEPCRGTEWPCGGTSADMLRGVVHDPTARRMQGAAGHAGVFSTAADLARFCRMLLNGGTIDGTRLLSPLTVTTMTSPAPPPGDPELRGLGWDLASRYAAPRGDLFPLGSFGHTGFTGTSIWIDPWTQTFVVILSNRVHPDGRGDVTALRSAVATVAAGSLDDVDMIRIREARLAQDAARSFAPRPAGQGMTRTGLDVLVAEEFERLRGHRVGLLTNQTGRSRTLESAIDLLHRAPGVTLTALFSPEHGIRGALDTTVPSSRDETTGLPIHSLYGDTRRPTAQMLEGIDTMVVDLQDIGTRFYTYMTTMAYVMEEAAKARVAVVVLDRPNPINGSAVDGPVLDKQAIGFTGYYPMPIRHGLTIGELALLFNGEKRIGANVSVVEMKDWTRGLWFDETGLPWINPSPNMRSLTAAILYPGIGAIEGTNISVGRGTDSPFLQVGAPWVDGVQLAGHLNSRQLPGIRFYPTTFTPSSSQYSGQLCQGVFMVVVDREALSPVRVGAEIAGALVRLHGNRFDLDAAATLFGSRALLARIKAGEDPGDIAKAWNEDLEGWKGLRKKYLLYR